MPYKKTGTIIGSILSMAVLLSFISFENFKTRFESVKVEGGLISGFSNADQSIHIFKGIPFAAAPVGNLRWKAPQPVIKWTGIKKCIEFSASPMQRSPVPFGPWSEEYLIPKVPINEDCLYLNLWTGAGSGKEKRPVIVWIYGGGFSSGGADVPIYDGEAMAKKGIVFVSINYRVGVFGFFAHPDLTKESGHNASGNYALMDQVAGIQWVKKNIAAFGGDPDNITVAGQSAGSMSINCLVASPLCKGLFRRAIAESGAAFISTSVIKPIPLKQAEAEGLRFTHSCNAAGIEDLRKMPADKLLNEPMSSAAPIVDGYVLPHAIAEIFAAGKQNDVGLLTGWNQDDGAIFGKIKTAEEFKKQIDELYGPEATEFFKSYPDNSDEEAAESQAAFTRDWVFGMQNYTWANLQADNSKYPVWLYRFTRRLPATGDYIKYGAFHTGEVAYAYNNLSFVHRCPWEPVDHSLAATMSSYWVNFAATGDPNGSGLPRWPAYNTKEFQTMMLGITTEAEPLPGKAGLDFLIKNNKQD